MSSSNNSSDNSMPVTDTIFSGLGTFANDTYDYINGLLSTPSIIFIFLLVIVIYLIVFASLGSNGSADATTANSSNGASGTTIIGTIVVGIFIVLVLINGFQYFFGIDIVASLKNIASGNPEVDITIDQSRLDAAKNAPVPEILMRRQVFNIPGNDYVYEDAKALCKAYGSRLATYKEVEDAYKDGGEWCNYGWSDGQMALFPTQYKTWANLQKIEGHENDCGRPGVNGGYMANPKVRYGVNCYGFKPRMTPVEEDLMATQPIYPKTEKDIAMENRVNYWKDKLSDILVSPFNHNSWSRL